MGESKINDKLFQDRKRTNILSNPEQRFISYLVPKIPSWISSNGLTGIGVFGSVLILLSFLLAKYVAVPYLLVGVFGFFINWFGDSMDGRIAYYRNIPRKWYGFSLDIIADWLNTAMIGLGYIWYANGVFELLGYLLIVLYAWSMIISQLRYKITDIYTIDAGIVGPTEIRVVICLILIAEVFFTGVLDYLVAIICLILAIINVGDTNNLLHLGDIRDKAERQEKEKLAKEIK